MNRDKKTLVLLTPAFNAFGQEQWLPWQSVVVRAINALFPSLRIIIVAFHFPLSKEQKTSWQGNDVYLLNGAMKKKLRTAQRWFRAWRLLQRISKENDVIGMLSFFCSESALIGHHFAKRHRLPHKIWVLGQDAKKENKEVARIRPEPGELVCMSDFLRNEFYANHGILPAHVVPVGIDTSIFSKKPGTRDIDLLGVGSLIPLKQYDLFVDIVEMISARLPSLQATICGDGGLREALVEKAESLGIAAKISFTGFLPHRQTLSFMSRAKILLHTSAYEGLGMVMLEALYAGAHVISFVKPLEMPVANWHVVQTKEEMARKALSLLEDENTTYGPTCVYSVADTARAIAGLFGIRH